MACKTKNVKLGCYSSNAFGGSIVCREFQTTKPTIHSSTFSRSFSGYSVRVPAVDQSGYFNTYPTFTFNV